MSTRRCERGEHRLAVIWTARRRAGCFWFLLQRPKRFDGHGALTHVRPSLDANMPLSTGPSILSSSSRTRCEDSSFDRRSVTAARAARSLLSVASLLLEVGGSSTTGSGSADEDTRAGEPRPGAARATPPGALAVASIALSLGSKPVGKYACCCRKTIGFCIQVLCLLFYRSLLQSRPHHTSCQAAVLPSSNLTDDANRHRALNTRPT